MITDIENAILQSLLELEAAVRNRAPGETRPNLLPLFAKIDDLTARLPAGADPQLQHFLRKKSYEKARLWLEGRQAEIQRGGCARD